MMKHCCRIGLGVGLLAFIVSLGVASTGYAEDKKGLRVDDLTKPIPRTHPRAKSWSPGKEPVPAGSG